MTIKLKWIVLACLAISLISCQAVFTTSPFSSFQRDMKDLPYDQKLGALDDALESGDTETMKDAYEEIQNLLENDPDNPELNVLAAELAVGASGVIDIIDDVANLGEDTDLDTLLEDVDLDLLDGVSEYVSTALENGSKDAVTDETLKVAAAMSVLSVVENDGDLSALEEWDGESKPDFGDDEDAEALEDAATFILAMDDPSEISDILTGFFE